MILHDLISFELLRVIWWALLGVLLIGFALTDGFDMGVGALLPFVGRTDVERRVAINTIGPVWEGNQVWFILGGGAIFAAWPPLYAVSFSGFYLAMFVVLAALILRPVAFKYRSKRIEARWRSSWDWALFVGGFVPALIFGVAVGNVLQGVPFRLDDTLRAFYEGSFFGLLNPFALLCGLMSVAMLAMHGAVWLTLKAGGVVGERARNFGTVAAVATIALFALGGLALANWVDGYALAAPMAADGPSRAMVTATFSYRPRIPSFFTMSIEQHRFWPRFCSCSWILTISSGLVTTHWAVPAAVPARSSSVRLVRPSVARAWCARP